MASDNTCRSCDYYKFALKYNEMDLDDRKTHFAANTLAYADAIDFEHGTVLTKIALAPPRLVESIAAYNIVFYDRYYYGIPWAAGPLHVDSVDVRSIDGVIVEDSLGRARAAIKRRTVEGGER